MKRILITSTDLMMVQFLLPHVKHLSENGYEVEIACSEVGGRLDEVREKLEGVVKKVHEVRLRRNPLHPINYLKGYGDMKKVVAEGNYDIIWTNEPVMGVVTRLAARETRKKGTKVLYMAHGFHFFTGAPKLNWLVYYPIEKRMAKHADVIATINMEDFHHAENMPVKRASYIHGIGVDTSRLKAGLKTCAIREEIGINDSDLLALSVGELNSNKNHQIVIRALGKLQRKDIHYAICGRGALLEELSALAKDLRIEKNVHFLGYRKDVVAICSQSDCFIFPSLREGLGLAPLEAMYTGIPLLTSRRRGPVDFMTEGETGFLFDPTDVDDVADKIKMITSDRLKAKGMGTNNKTVVQPFLIENVKKEVLELINSLNDGY